MTDVELTNNVVSLRDFAEALGELITYGIIEREHAKALAKAYLKKYGFDVPRPLKTEVVKKEEPKQ